MIMWNIVNEEQEWTIEVGQITVLKGSSLLWYKIIRYIDDYFTSKNTNVQVFEDTLLLPKKDWECYFIPYDAHLEIEKITSKSPLRPIIDEISDELSVAPSYQELLSVWDDLREEINFVKVEQYGLELHLDQFDHNHLKSFFTIKAIKSFMSPMEYKKLLLTLFTKKSLKKNRLIIIELPELYADPLELKNFIEIVLEVSKAGVRFILVTQEDISQNRNFVIEDKIINSASIDNIRRIVLNEVPFFCEDEMYEEAKEYILQAVDNSNSINKTIHISTALNDAVKTLIYVILHHLNLKADIDTTGMPFNLIEFTKTY